MAFGNSRGGFLESIPTVTKNLLIINLLMWVATLVFQKRGIDLTSILGLQYFESEGFRIWQPITYMFMHDASSFSGGFMHIFCNMFNLWMFGSLVERALGERRFLIYYMVCGIGAGFIQELVWHFTWMGDFAASLTVGGAPASLADVQAAIASGDPQVKELMRQFFGVYVTVGASGAVFGLLLAFGMMFPNLKMFIIPFPFPIKAKWMVIGYGLFELVCGTRGLMVGVAHFAHLGGMLFGILMILYWKRKGIIGGGGYGYMG